jgi:hypothetical protein
MFARAAPDREPLASRADSRQARRVSTLRVVGEVAATRVSALASVTRLATLEDVLRWGGDVLEVVVQDEYTHDVVVRAPGGGDGFLVFDTT